MKDQARHPALRTALLCLGFLLLAITPLVGPIPGPGGLLTFAGGMILILRNSNWARRVFARTKRRWPRFGHYADMALRRPSFHRRRERDRLAQAGAGFGDTTR
jgi:hypothetical protein